MTDTILPDGTKMSVILANLNVFTSNPSTSEGEGEIIYNSTDNKVYVNTGTTTTPVWTEIGSGSGVTDHNLLNNLTWSAAGHTINADIDMDYNKLQLGSSTYIQDVIAEVRYISDDYHKFYIGSTELLSIDSEWVDILGGLDIQGSGLIFKGSTSYKLGANTTTGTLKYESSLIHEFEIGVGNTIMKLDADGIDLNGKKLELDSNTIINDNAGDMELHVGTGKCVKIVVG